MGPIGFANFVSAVRGARPAKQEGQKRQTLKLDVYVIEGRIQKPQAFYILQRSPLNFEGLTLQKSFLPKIVEAVEKNPF